MVVDCTNTDNQTRVRQVLRKLASNAKELRFLFVLPTQILLRP